MSVGRLYVLSRELSLLPNVHFLIELFILVFSSISFFNMFWKLTSYQMYCWKICTPHAVGCLISLLMVSFCCAEAFKFDVVMFVYFFLSFPFPKEIYRQKITNERCLRFYCLCFLWDFYDFMTYI